jgi:murein DD-endopeptidase MepM/ murein hydrolase activator NlpD
MRKIDLSILSSGFWVLGSVLCVLFSGCSTGPRASSLNQVFASFPSASLKQRPILPTDNEGLLNGDNYRYVARTGYNSLYGMPGWSRNGGTRFHEGVDIQPISTVASKYKMSVDRADPATGKVIKRLENVRIPKDKVYAILDGLVVISSPDANRSGYGKYVIIEHAWSDGTTFYTLYGHLSAINIHVGKYVSQGTTIGIMGQTAKDEASRAYLRANPHLHFEVGKLIDSTSTAFSGKFDPRNLQPYPPLEFLTHYDAQSRKQWAAAKAVRTPVIATVGPH